MVLKPQDLLVALKLATRAGPPPAYGRLGAELHMSASEVHQAVRRAVRAGLIGPDRRPNRTALLDFLLHGLRYVFVPERGQTTRGMPTAHAAPPLAEEIASAGPPPVWPDPDGPARGEAFEPLYRSAIPASRDDPALYRCLALVDALRGGRARERDLAARHLRALLS